MSAKIAPCPEDDCIDIVTCLQDGGTVIAELPTLDAAAMDKTQIPSDECEDKFVGAEGEILYTQDTTAANKSPSNGTDMVQRAKQLKNRRASDANFRSRGGFRKNTTAGLYLQYAPENATPWQLRRWEIAQYMEHWTVKGFIMLAILANAVMIGVEADYGDSSFAWKGLEMCFLCIFTTELVMNMIGFGWLHFKDIWNCVDAFVVVFSILDLMMTLALSSDSTGLSVLRLVRLVRVFRLVSSLEKLVYLVAAFAKGMQSAGWVLILMVLAMYIFAVLAKSFFGDSKELQEELAGTLDVKDLFGTIPKCFITLIQLYTFDSSISMIQRPIGRVFPWAWLYFLLFMVVVSIGMLELMTSIFIDSLLEEKKVLEKRRLNEKDKHRNEVKELIRGLFDEYDVDKNGQLDPEELKNVMLFFDDDDTKALLDEVAIDPQMMQEAIRLSDINGNEMVTQDEFMRALDSIHAEPRVSNVREVHQHIATVKLAAEHNTRETIEEIKRAVKEEVNEEVRKVAERLERVEGMLVDLRHDLNLNNFRVMPLSSTL